MIDLPEDIKKYLVKDELVDSHFSLKGHCEIYTSTYRMFIRADNTVKDISYNHISSLEVYEKRNHWLIFVGIVLAVGAFILRQYAPPDWAFRFPWGRLLYGYGDDDSFGGWFYYVLGAILFIIGYRQLTSGIKFRVAGLPEEQVLSGQKDTINALFRVLNERRFSPTNAIQTKRPTNHAA